MKRTVIISLFIFLAFCCKAQTMPSVIDSINVGYSDIVRFQTNYIAGLREHRLDIRDAAYNSLGALSNSLPIADIQAAGSSLQTKDDFVYAIYSKITPVNVINPLAPVPGTPVDLPDHALSSSIWNNLLIIGCNNRSYIYSLAMPGIPVLVDSINTAIKEIKYSGNNMYALQGNSGKIYHWKIAAAAPYLTLKDSFDMHSITISIDVANDQLLAKSVDTLYRFDLNAMTDFDLLSAEQMPSYPYNGDIVAINTSYLGYCKYNSFSLSFGVAGNSFIDSFMLSYGQYRLGNGKLDGNIFYGDFGSTRLIGFNNSTVVKEQFSQTDPSVYPNPVTGVFTIRMAETGNYIYKLTDNNGRTLQSGSFHNVSKSVNTSSLPVGIYLLQLQNGGQSIAKKIMKE